MSPSRPRGVELGGAGGAAHRPVPRPRDSGVTASIAPPASRDPSVAEATAPSIVRQRLVIVLPSTGEFDSRTYRIATGVAARGHDVTVLARAAAGVPDVEAHPAGYRIVRVPVDPVAALPLPAIWRRLRSLRRSRRPGQGPTDGAAEPHRSGRR